MGAIALPKHTGRDSCDYYATRSTPATGRPVERHIKLARFESGYCRSQPRGIPVMQHLICLLLLGGFAFLLIARPWTIDPAHNQRATRRCLLSSLSKHKTNLGSSPCQNNVENGSVLTADELTRIQLHPCGAIRPLPLVGWWHCAATLARYSVGMTLMPANY
jgi:hypothetical protein